jgi:hypothetical protein
LENENFEKKHVVIERSGKITDKTRTCRYGEKLIGRGNGEQRRGITDTIWKRAK